MTLSRRAHRVLSGRSQIEPLGLDLYAAIESTRHGRLTTSEYACHLLGLPLHTALTDAQVAEAADVAMSHLFTGGEEIP